MAGVQESKELLGFGLSVGEGVAALIDQGPSLADALKFLEAVKRAPAAFKNIAQVLPEMKELDELEKAELKSFVVADFDIPQDKAEEVVEGALCLVIELSDLLNLLKK